MAHDSVMGLTGLPAMLLHPLVTPEQLLGLAAAGLLAGQRGRNGWGAAPIGLLVGLAASFAYLYLWAPFARPAVLPLLAAGLLGGLAAWGARLPLVVLASAGIGLGFALGMDTLSAAQTFAHALTMLVATALATAAMLSLAGWGLARLERGWQRIALRVAGSWIAAVAVMVLALLVYRRG